MSHNVFEYRSYRQYLKDRLESMGPKSGLKRKASEALAVHTTFISQVVLGKADLSLDQGERMNQFLRHSTEEGEFFLELLIFERASDSNLKKRYEAKIRERLAQHSQINKRLDNTKELNVEAQEKFYSSYLYGLLHVLSSVARFQTRERIRAATGFAPEVTDEAIDFLLSIGVLKFYKNKIVPGEQHIHLGADSKNIWRHHSNWRLASLQKIPFGDASDLHYSLAFSCTKEVAAKLRESLLENLKRMSKTISASPEEEVYVYCFDLFKW